MFNDEVYNIVKDTIFKHPMSNKKNDRPKKLSDFKLLEPDWKMKEIIENASSDFHKTENFLPIMTVKNRMKENIFFKDNDTTKYHSKDKNKHNFYKTGKIGILNSFHIKKPSIGTTSKLTMNLQI